MAQVTAEQMFNKVRQQAGRIAELELINESLTDELAKLQAKAEQAEIEDVAAEIRGKPKRQLAAVHAE